MSTPSNPSSEPPAPSKPLATRMWGGILSLALFVWGSYIAIGAYLADDERRAGKPLVIFGCTIFFVAIWNLVWWAAARRTQRDRS